MYQRDLSKRYNVTICRPDGGILADCTGVEVVDEAPGFIAVKDLSSKIVTWSGAIIVHIKEAWSRT